ncbi:hypothetical protein D9615_010695 [Tricholomella constricta]|uniref:Uncharacterized protein n=1 Tax=Tricholomella constricta TaxID=117010 RepID=A0A8H5GKN7_9AGAR|nr:hypothetical protein D9615_010695 [Tricholomella constricta]
MTARFDPGARPIFSNYCDRHKSLQMKIFLSQFQSTPCVPLHLLAALKHWSSTMPLIRSRLLPAMSNSRVFRRISYTLAGSSSDSADVVQDAAQASGASENASDGAPACPDGAAAGNEPPTQAECAGGGTDAVQRVEEEKNTDAAAGNSGGAQPAKSQAGA